MSSERDFGEVVSLEVPCAFPKHVPITGRLVRLLPLHADHSDGLFESIGGDQNASLYDYMPYGPFSDIESSREHIAGLSKSTDPQFYTIVDLKTEKLLGHLSLLRIDEKNRVIEIGHVLFSPSLQKTTAATELLYLLANKDFEDCYRRLEWKCNAHNEASRRAALRFGYTFEGVFRQHMIVKGRSRDSAWYSIIDKEWPDRKRALEMWMDPSNFDGNCRQIKDLSSLRNKLDEVQDTVG